MKNWKMKNPGSFIGGSLIKYQKLEPGPRPLKRKEKVGKSMAHQETRERQQAHSQWILETGEERNFEAVRKSTGGLKNHFKRIHPKLEAKVNLPPNC